MHPRSAAPVISPSRRAESNCTRPSRHKTTGRPSILEMSMRACGGLPSMSLHPGMTHTMTPLCSATRRLNVSQFGQRGGIPSGPGRIFSHFGISSTAGSCPMVRVARSSSRAANARACGETASPSLSIAAIAARVEESDPPRILPVCPVTTSRRLASSRRTSSCASISALSACVFPGVRVAGTVRRPVPGSASWSTTRNEFVRRPASPRSVVTSLSVKTWSWSASSAHAADSSLKRSLRGC